MKAAQIGIGGWGKNHTRILSNLGVLTTICDTDEKKAQEYAQKYSVSYHTSIESLLSSEEFDTAFICTPTSTHFAITSEMIQAKKNVFVEKPLTYSSEEGEQLLNLANRNKVLLTCGYIERFNPAVASVKNFVKTKRFGEPVMLEFHRENRMPLHIKDVGIIYDTTVHDIDTAMWLFDEAPEVIFARAGQIKHEHEDFATIMLGFKDNKVAIISSNWITPTRVRTFNVVCTEAIISGDFVSQEIKIEKSSDTEIPRQQKQEPLLLELQSFIDAVDGKGDLIVKPEEAVNVTKIAEAALLSSNKGIPIYLELK